MNPVERQLATLLAEAPGEPPKLIDADALLAHRLRRRYLAPVLAAAAVVAIAVPVGLILANGSIDDSTNPPAAPRPLPTQNGMTVAQAIKVAEDALHDAPVLPGAHSVARPPTSLLDTPSSTPRAPTLVQRTKFWLAPGRTDAAIQYFKAHPPTAMHVGASGSSSGPGQPTAQFIQFTAGAPRALTILGDQSLSLEFTVVASGSGVAVRVDAQLIRVPTRPDWAFVPDSVTSADVTVSRSTFDGGVEKAPTVLRTLTGEALERLADAINALPSRAPEGVHGCFAITATTAWPLDKVVFHIPDEDIQVMHAGQCMWNAVLTAVSSHRHVYVDDVEFDKAILSALGLPDDYGNAH
jgi:hypothetical protein